MRFPIKTYQGAAALGAALLIFLGVWILSAQAVAVGDDLGYAFTDTQLHSGDGHPVQTLGDIISTQAKHYRTTNGRFAIHSTVQAFVALIPAALFPPVNALIFVLLLTGVCKWLQRAEQWEGAEGNSASHIQTRCAPWKLLIFTALLMWICIPRPGVTFLSLKAFAINYLWTGAATIWFLNFWNTADVAGKSPRLILGSAAALLVGSLQESYSLPICAGMAIFLLINRKQGVRRRLILSAFYAAGTLLTISAPGNFVRVGAGGGFQAIGAKAAAMCGELLLSPVAVLAVIILAGLIWRRQQCLAWMRRRMVLLVAIATALALGALTFTALRQLFAPCIFAAMLLGDIVLHSRLRNVVVSRWGCAACALLLAALMGSAFAIREHSRQSYMQAIQMVRAGRAVVWGNTSSNLYNRSGLARALFERYDADPFADHDLKFIADTYTKQGLGRIYSPTHSAKAVSAVLPAAPFGIIQAGNRATWEGEIVLPGKIDAHWGAFYVEADTTRYRVRPARGGHARFERVRIGARAYYIVPLADAPFAVSKIESPK